MTALLASTPDTVDLHAIADDPVPDPSGWRRERTVVVAVNGTTESIAALRWAAATADDANLHLLIVTAFSRAHVGVDAPISCHDLQVDAEASARVAARRAIDAVFSSTWGDHPDRHATRPVRHVVDVGSIDTVLDRYGTGAAMIVIGTRLRRRWWHRFRSSTTNRVTGSATCPVISIPSTAAPTPRKDVAG
ncbi:MAG: universal stress protein [Ilumatobacter sp.]|jgi:nucleotide-binding universal stress UspA family protein|uniref:universal stress protein n=1 Tax=Ilumatobacter sp. TaxID=1967498 RepID=UPI0039190FEF